MCALDIKEFKHSLEPPLKNKKKFFRA